MSILCDFLSCWTEFRKCKNPSSFHFSLRYATPRQDAVTSRTQIYLVKSCKAGTVPIRYIGIISQGERWCSW